MPRNRRLVDEFRSDAFGVDLDVDALAARALGRAAGAPSKQGNAVRLLLDAGENFPAWLDAIRGAQRLILFECYIVDDDEVGREFAQALADRARDGVQVYVLYDWIGSFGARRLWDGLRSSGVQVAAFNPFQFGSPFGWVTRDHRKMIAIDGRIGFVSGLCVSGRWFGNPARRLEPWRDTGVAIFGPAVSELEQAFASVWQATGEAPIADALLTPAESIPNAGTMSVRVVAGQPASASTYRLDLVIAALAHERLWLTDAYFVGTAAYVQALRAAAADGVDVRLLVPGASDIPAVSMLSRAGYRSLLDAGVRVYEWNGTMLHAKTAVADGHWARIGSTNLNLASLLGNYELDVAIEDPAFAARMADQFEQDLARSTEIVLTARNRVRRAEPRGDPDHAAKRARVGSAARAAAGAVSLSSTLGAALTNRRALGPAEGGLLAKTAVSALTLAVVGVIWPQVIAWPAAVLAAWIGVAWLGRAWGLKRAARRAEAVPTEDHPAHERAAGTEAVVPALRGDPASAEAPRAARDAAEVEAGTNRG